MGGGSRGKTKGRLRDLSIRPLTRIEQDALFDAVFAKNPPIAQAILGTVLVEHELEDSIRRNLAIKDEVAWLTLVDERGPLDTFSRKILMGRALGIYDDATETNLNIIRSVRNAFAHSKRPLDFNNPLIASELQKITDLTGAAREDRFIGKPRQSE